MTEQEGTKERRVKFVERGGVTVKDLLVRNNPWGKVKCGRDKCMSCPWSKEGGECRQESVVYQIECVRCKGEGVLAEYWGETARTAFERGEEHLSGLEARYEKNSLWKHSLVYHEGSLTRTELKMTVVERHRSPLTRQIQEGVELECSKAKIIMNSKSEWNHSRIPRIMIEVGEEIEGDIESGMVRSTELGGRERGSKSLRVEGAEKRQRQTETGGATKRLRQEYQEGNKSKILKPREGGKQVRTEKVN